MIELAADEKHNLGSFTPDVALQKGNMISKVNEELKDIELKLEKHKGKEEFIKNLQARKEILLKQLEEIKKMPDIIEYMKKMNEAMNNLIALGKEQSNLEKKYMELLDK